MYHSTVITLGHIPRPRRPRMPTPEEILELILLQKKRQQYIREINAKMRKESKQIDLPVRKSDRLRALCKVQAYCRLHDLDWYRLGLKHKQELFQQLT